MVTGATHYKEHFFKTEHELDMLQGTLVSLSTHYHWHLEGWSLFSNHYHFIAQSPEDPTTLKKLITHFHANTSRQLNTYHQTPGRKVWYQYWDTQLTHHDSYMARLHYVMQNPVKHKIVECPKAYKWCSAGWHESNTSAAHYKTVTSFKIDAVSIPDDF